MSESLRDLRDDLAGLDTSLVVRTGPTIAVLERMARRHGCAHLVHRDHRGRLPGMTDTAFDSWASRTGLQRHPISDPLDPAASPVRLPPVPGVEPGPIPTAVGLGLVPDPCPHRQSGGRRRAEAVLATYLARPHAVPSPRFVAAERSASRLSPYLAHGVLSASEVRRAVSEARAKAPPSTRLAAPLLRGLDRRASLLAIPPPDAVGSSAEPCPDHLAAWRAGQTGLPFTDACLRYLAATGWLPDRARTLVLAVACHHLRLDWRAATSHIAAMSTDHDPRLLWPLAHRIVHGDGSSPPRIPDPVAEGLAMDPEGTLIRAWVPELKALPDAALHRPWRWEGARTLLGRHYPEPLVDPVTATRAARAGAGSAAQLDLGISCRR